MTLFLILTVILVAADQFSKYIALTSLKPVGNITFIKGFMDFTFVENRGAAFGILNGARWLFVIITIAVTAVIIYYIAKKCLKQRNINFCL